MHQTLMFLISSGSCLCSIQWSQVLSREWRCSWSSADRRCSNYIWVIDNFIAYNGDAYIRDLTVDRFCVNKKRQLRVFFWLTFLVSIKGFYCFTMTLPGPGLLRNFYDKIHVSEQECSNRASDWLAAQPPANQKPCWKILVNHHEFSHGYFS